jgi:hypothetical protein
MAHDRGCEILEIQLHTVTIEQKKRNSILLVQHDWTHSQYPRSTALVSKVRFSITPGLTGPVSPSILSASQIWTCLPFLLTIPVSLVPPAATFLPPPSCLLYHRSCPHTSPLTLGPTFPRSAVCIYTPPSPMLRLRANR